jgi:hypothetical protein
VNIAIDVPVDVPIHIPVDVAIDVAIRAVEVAAVRYVAASTEIAAIYPVMHAAAAMHASTTAMRAAATVARSPAAPCADLKEQTIVHPRGGGPRSVHFDCLRLRRCEAQQRCDRDPSADRSESVHRFPPLSQRAENGRLCRMSCRWNDASRFPSAARG